jgi:hypothetical protein
LGLFSIQLDIVILSPGNGTVVAMTHFFISYSKSEPQPTIALAHDLEAVGLSVWWDTSLLPDDPHFPETIRQQIDAAVAAIVIWTPSSVHSRWVYAEAKTADEQGKLIQLRTPALDPHLIPLPFNTGQIGAIQDRRHLYLALFRRFKVVLTELTQEQVDRGRELMRIPPNRPWTDEENHQFQVYERFRSKQVEFEPMIDAFDRLGFWGTSGKPLPLPNRGR